MKVLFFILSWFFSFFAFAQSDTEFWFAAPEVSDRHGDQPIELWVTSYNLDVNLTLSFPANYNIVPQRFSVPANEFELINLTKWKRNLELTIPDSVLNQGLLLTADAPMSAQYVVRGNGNNMDVFSLKGKNALGKKFIAPAQSKYRNQDFFNGVEPLNAFSTIDIVATENNTVVTILPSQDIVGHNKGVSYQIILNKGQTYSLQANGLLAEDHLGGTVIEASKPIAVTVKDDSVLKGDNWDLLGDQIVPTKAYDSIYVTLKGEFYVQGVLDGTSFNYAGVNHTINEGETQYFEQSSTFEFLQGDKPLGVFQLVEIEGPIGYELAGGVLGAWNCHRNSRSNFYRTPDEQFELYIVTDLAGLGSFELDGQSWDLSTKFSEVPSSNGLYAAAIDQDFLTDSIAANSAHELVNNSSDFIFSYKFGSPTTGAGFSYLSNFGFVDLGDSVSFCDNLQGVLSAGVEHDSYLWNTGQNSSSIQVNLPGMYSVKVTNNECQFEDSVFVSYSEGVELDLKDTSVCEGDTLSIRLLEEWSILRNGTSSKNQFNITRSSKETIYAVNDEGCFDEKAFVVDYIPNPEIVLVEEVSLCSGQTVQLGEYKFKVNYEWSTGDTLDIIEVSQPGIYTLRSYNSCGEFYSATEVFSWDFQVPNTITPNQDGVNDYFEIVTDAPGVWQIEIFNRWGKKVYQSENYLGEFNADGLSDGTYYYRIYSKGAACTEHNDWLYITR